MKKNSITDRLFLLDRMSQNIYPFLRSYKKFICTSNIIFLEHLSFRLILVRKVRESRRVKLGRNLEKSPNSKSCNF